MNAFPALKVALSKEGVTKASGALTRRRFLFFSDRASNGNASAEVTIE